MPYPIRYIWTCYQAFGYIREAYQTLARKELTMEVLGLFGDFIVLVYEPIQDSLAISCFMLDLGNHLDQWSLKKLQQI